MITGLFPLYSFILCTLNLKKFGFIYIYIFFFFLFFFFFCYSITQSCSIFWEPIDCSTPGFPVLHYLLKFAQTYVHWVDDAIQSSRPLSSPSPLAFNLSQHQGLFQWLSSLHQVAKVLELQLQHQYLQWIFRTDFLSDWLFWSSCSPRDSEESSPASQLENIIALILQLSAFFMIQLPHDC